MSRTQPFSIEAEQSLIGGLLIDNSAWDKIADIVSEADFYRDDHRKIFAHIHRLIETGHPADVVTVFEAIERANQVNQTGGIAYLGEIANATPSSANIRRYAEIVRDRAIMRKLLAAADDITESVLSPSFQDTRKVLDEAERKILEIAESGNRWGSGSVPVNEALTQVIEHIERRSSSNDELSGIETGFTDLDNLTSGLQPGDMIVVAGRPSMGKTAFALNIAEHVGAKLKKPVAIFSLEMSVQQVAARLISSLGHVGTSKVLKGKLANEDWDGVSIALAQLHDAPIHIDETPALTITELRARTRRLHRQYHDRGGLALVVIDYIQLMSAGKDSENRVAEISEISRSIKALAKEIGAPVIALSQLSRRVEERMDKRPVMSDLRESGAIEQDADLILMMYREEYYKPDTTEKGVAEVIIGKHRNGPTGSIKLTFLGEYAKFANYARC